MSRVALALILTLAGCGSTGGFRVDAGGGGGGEDGRFVEQVIDQAVRHGQGLTVVDVDNNGSLDVVAASSLTDTVRLYLNQGGGQDFDTIDLGPSGTTVGMDAEVADLDGDGDPDVAAVGLFDRAGGFASPGELLWFENSGDPTDDWAVRRITGPTLWAANTVEYADITGNGSPDLIVAQGEAVDPDGNPQGNGVHWFRNDGTGTFGGPFAIDADLNEVRSVRILDVDADGVQDVVAAGGGSGEVAWYRNTRAPGTTENDPVFAKSIIAAGTAPYEVTFANLDEDPELELLTTISRGGDGELVWFDPPADPTQPWTETIIASDFGAGSNARVLAADLSDAPGLEIAASSNTVGELRIYELIDGVYVSSTIRSGYTGITFLRAGDINGDGRVDLVTSTYENGATDLISWWENRP